MICKVANAIKDGKFTSQAYFHKKLIVCTSVVFAKMSYRKLINIWTFWIAQCLLVVAQQHSAIHPPHPCTVFHNQRKRYDITLIKVVHTFKMNAKTPLICHQSYWSTTFARRQSCTNRNHRGTDESFRGNQSIIDMPDFASSLVMNRKVLIFYDRSIV